MKKNLWIAIVVSVVGVCAVAVGVYYLAIHSKKVPAATAAFSTRSPSPVPVLRIYSPHLGDEMPVNAYVPIRVSSSSAHRIMALELWIDGSLFAARDDLATINEKMVTGEWYWQPAITGVHSLFARSVDENGQTGYSEIVTINATEVTGSLQLVFPQPGQTLGDIAGEYNVELPAVVSLNPAIDPVKSLEPEQQIFLPHDPDPVKIVEPIKLIAYQSPLSEKLGGLSGLTPGPVVPEEAPGSQGPAQAASLPNAPTLISAGIQGTCDAALEFKDNSVTENGFRIYRAAPGQSGFTKIADLPPLISKNLLYTDKALATKGKWTYYAAAYNDYGETQSLPAAIEISDPGCLPLNPPPTSLLEQTAAGSRTSSGIWA